MSNTYSNDPSTSTKDEVRFYIGDVDSADWQLSDEEIAFLLSQESDNATRAAIRAARTLYARFTRLVDKTVGDLSISYSQRAKQYLDLISQLETQAALATNAARPYAGGISKTEKQRIEEDTDAVLPVFKRGMMDYHDPASNAEEN